MFFPEDIFSEDIFVKDPISLCKDIVAPGWNEQKYHQVCSLKKSVLTNSYKDLQENISAGVPS